MRLRQAALVALDLEPLSEHLLDVFRIGAPYRDPGVEIFGLHNVVLPFGDTFLEIVAPLRGDTAAGRYRERQGGDGGYMLLLQTDDLEASRARLATNGVREVWSAELPDIRAVHLHPRDTGGALLSLDQPDPPQEWRWAGPNWRERGGEFPLEIVAAELRAPDPAVLARRWGEILGLSPRRAAAGDWILDLDRGRLRFSPSPFGQSLAAIDVATPARAQIRAAARRRGLPGDDSSFDICGIRINLVA